MQVAFLFPFPDANFQWGNPKTLSLFCFFDLFYCTTWKDWEIRIQETVTATEFGHRLLQPTGVIHWGLMGKNAFPTVPVFLRHIQQSFNVLLLPTKWFSGCKGQRFHIVNTPYTCFLCLRLFDEHKRAHTHAHTHTHNLNVTLRTYQYIYIYFKIHIHHSIQTYNKCSAYLIRWVSKCFVFAR